MSTKVMTLVWKRSHYEDSSSLTVMLALADWCDDDGKCYPSIPRLAIKARQSERNVQYILRRLETDGFLVTVRHPGTQSLYQFDLARLRSLKPLYTERVRGAKAAPPTGASVAPPASDNEVYGDETLSDSSSATVAPPDGAQLALPVLGEGCTPCTGVVQRLHRSGANSVAHIRKNRQGTIREPSEENHVESSSRPGGVSIKSQVEEVFGYWKEKLNHPGALLSDKREKKIRLRLKDGFTIEQLKSAIDGCRASPHHMGVNDTSTIYDDLELICRDPEHVEKFIAIRDRDGTEVGKERAREKIKRDRELINRYRDAAATGD